MTDPSVELVQRAIKCIYGTQMPPPEHDLVIVGTLLAVFAPDSIPEEFRGLSASAWERTRNNFAFELTQAIDCIRRVRDARWRN
jgi:hypothetical protein